MEKKIIFVPCVHEDSISTGPCYLGWLLTGARHPIMEVPYLFYVVSCFRTCLNKHDTQFFSSLLPFFNCYLPGEAHTEQGEMVTINTAGKAWGKGHVGGIVSGEGWKFWEWEVIVMPSQGVLLILFRGFSNSHYNRNWNSRKTVLITTRDTTQLFYNKWLLTYPICKAFFCCFCL